MENLRPLSLPLVDALDLVAQRDFQRLIEQAERGSLTQGDLEVYADQQHRRVLKAFIGGCDRIAELNAANGGASLSTASITAALLGQ